MKTREKFSETIEPSHEIKRKRKNFVSEITARSRMHDRVDRIIIHSKSLASLQRTDPAKIALNTLSLSFIKFFPNVLIRSKECLSPFPSLLSIFSTGETFENRMEKKKCENSYLVREILLKYYNI